MPTALELTREGWKPYLEAARRRPAPPEPTPAERRERACLLARVREAAEALKLTAADLLDLEIIDEVIEEPLGGAHYDHETTAKRVGKAIRSHFDELSKLAVDDLLEQRYARLRKHGRLREGE